MLTFTPIELQSIVNAALFEIARHPGSYKLAKPAAAKLYRWLISTIWDNAEEPCIMVDEKPF